MKRAPVFLLAFVLLVLYGCGGDTAPTATPIPPKPSATTAPTSAPATAVATTAPATAPTTAPATAAPGGAATPTAAPGGATSGTTPPAATGTIPAAVVNVAMATLPTSVTIALTPPALPALSTFTGAPGPAADKAVTVTAPVSITGKLATDGTEHWYQVDLTKYKGGTLVLDFTAASGAASEQSVTVINPAGDQLDRKDVAAGASEHIEQVVESAIYKISVTGGVDAQNAYRLGIGFHPNSPHLDRANAVPLGLAGTVTGLINSTSDAQWFAVDMSKYPQSGLLTASLAVPAEAQGQYRLALMDASAANTLDYKDVDQATTGALTVEPDKASNYFLVVQSHGFYNFTAPYTLTVTFAPHSAYSSAKAALAVTPPALLKVTMPAPKDVAYVSFTLTGTAQLTAAVTVPADGNPTRVEFFDASGQNNFGGSSDVQPGSQGDGSATLSAAGTYVMAIERRGGEAISSNPTTVELRVAPNP